MAKSNNNDYDIGLEIAFASSAYRAAGLKTLKAHGQDDITREQYGILVLLSLGDGLYQTQIANILGKDRPNITRMIDILETKGLIRREKDTDNRRILKVFLTGTGRKKARKVKRLKQRMNKAQCKDLSDEDIEIIVTLLRKVRKNIAEEYKIEI